MRREEFEKKTKKQKKPKNLISAKKKKGKEKDWFNPYPIQALTLTNWNEYIVL